MGKRTQKEKVIDIETTPPPVNKVLSDIRKINEPVDVNEGQDDIKQAVNLAVNKNLIIRFEELLNRFKGKTKAYFTYPSKVQLFETGCAFLKHRYTSNGIYHSAPANFKKFISRKGKRPKSDEHEVRKGNNKAMYLTISEETFETYYNLIFSFLRDRNDIGSEYYSSSYFFYDFVIQLEELFEELCQFEINFPRE